MKKQMFSMVVALSLLVAASSILVSAQGRASEEQVQILRAQFGAGNQWVDVTSRVQALVKGEGLNFRADTDNLLVDPAPGQPKILRLQVRDVRGAVRELSYPEKTVVRLYVGNGYGAQPYGNGQGAPYGNQQYGNGNPQDNQYGDRRDRDRDHDRDGDRDRNNGQYGNSGQYSAGYGQGLQITRAEYGSGYRVRDVTARVASMVQNGQLSIRVSSDNLGGDPAYEQPKMLTVYYTYNGRSGQASANERDTLVLPGRGESNYYQSRLRITRAQYGAESRFVDVTSQLNSLVQGDSLNFQVSNQALGGDPAPGERKVLTVFYVMNGRTQRAFANEGEVLVLPRNGGGGDDDAYYRKYWPGHAENDLRVLQATWGARDRQIDVTSRIAGYVQGNRLNMPVSNQALGGDPALGATKYLRVVYLWRGLRYEANATEGQTLSIP
jgi:hypothetical protein